MASLKSQIQYLLNTKIADIQEWANVYWIKPVQGRPCFVSKRAVQAALPRKGGSDFLVAMKTAAAGTVFLCGNGRGGLSIFFALGYELRKVNAAIGAKFNYVFGCWELPTTRQSVNADKNKVLAALLDAGLEIAVFVA